MASRTTTARAGRDDREGLSPSPQRRGLTNVWEEEDDDDDEKNDGIDYEPAPEQSEDMDQDDTDGEDMSDYTGTAAASTPTCIHKADWNRWTRQPQWSGD